MSRNVVLVAVGVAALAVGAAAVTAARAGEEPGQDAHRVVIFRSGGSWLGVQIADVDADRAHELGLKEEMGAEVQSVSPGSPAEEAGIKEGDVITEYQGTRVEGVMQLTRLVRETPAGRTATLKVFHDGSSRTVQVKVAERDGSGDQEIEKHIEIGPGHGMHWMQAPGTPAPPVPPVIDLDEMDIPGLMEMVGPHGRPRLGITVDSLGKQLAGYFGVKQGSGVLVTSVSKGDAGDTAGLKAGDVIVKVDDEEVGDASDLHMALRDRRDKEVRLTIVRDRREQVLNVPAPPKTDKPASPRGAAQTPEADLDSIRAQVRQALRQAEAVRVDRAEIERQVQDALRAAQEAARQAEESRRQADELKGKAEEMRRETVPAPAAGGAVDIKNTPDQERDDIRRAVIDARRLRTGVQEQGD
jgi:serine protease Do